MGCLQLSSNHPGAGVPPPRACRCPRTPSPRGSGVPSSAGLVFIAPPPAGWGWGGVGGGGVPGEGASRAGRGACAPARAPRARVGGWAALGGGLSRGRGAWVVGAPAGEGSPGGEGPAHLAAADDVGVRGQQVHHLAFALVPPLRAQHHRHARAARRRLLLQPPPLHAAAGARGPVVGGAGRSHAAGWPVRLPESPPAVKRRRPGRGAGPVTLVTSGPVPPPPPPPGVGWPPASTSGRTDGRGARTGGARRGPSRGPGALGIHEASAPRPPGPGQAWARRTHPRSRRWAPGNGGVPSSAGCGCRRRAGSLRPTWRAASRAGGAHLPAAGPAPGLARARWWPRGGQRPAPGRAGHPGRAAGLGGGRDAQDQGLRDLFPAPGARTGWVTRG